MSEPRFTIEDLRRILFEAAGVDENIDLLGEILDTGFEELGYESLALLETGSRIEREYDILLDDDVMISIATPRALIEIVNEQLKARA